MLLVKEEIACPDPDCQLNSAIVVPLKINDQTVGALNVIIYALGGKLVNYFKLNKSEVGVGLGLGTPGHTIGVAYALELGELQGAMAAIAVVVIGLVIVFVAPLFIPVLAAMY